MRPAILLAAGVALAANPARADVTTLFPDNTAYVVRFNVNAILAQPSVAGDAKAIKSALGEAAKVMASCGIDPTRDIARATLAVGSDASARTAVILVEGAFDAAKVNARLAALSAERKDEVEARANGVFRWTLPPDSSPPAVTLPRQYFVAVLDGQSAALGIDEGAVNDAVDKKAGRKRGEPAKAVIDLLRKADPRLAVNLVAVPPPAVVGTSRVAGLLHVTGGLAVSDSVRFEVNCATKDAETAKSLAEAIDNAVAMYKEFGLQMAAQSKAVSPKQLAMLREFFSTFKVAATPTGVTLTSVLSKAFLDKNAK